MASYGNTASRREKACQVAKARREMGLPPLDKKHRKCLRCDVEFRSEQANNRMCVACRVRT